MRRKSLPDSESGRSARSMAEAAAFTALSADLTDPSASELFWRGMRRGALGTFVAFLALAVFWTWPLAAHFTSRMPHDPGDPILNIWLLWWNAQAVPFTDRWWSPPIFHPMAGALALSEHLAGIGVVTTPLQLARRQPAHGVQRRADPVVRAVGVLRVPAGAAPGRSRMRRAVAP